MYTSERGVQVRVEAASFSPEQPLETQTDTPSPPASRRATSTQATHPPTPQPQRSTHMGRHSGRASPPAPPHPAAHRSSASPPPPGRCPEGRGRRPRSCACGVMGRVAREGAWQSVGAAGAASGGGAAGASDETSCERQAASRPRFPWPSKRRSQPAPALTP